MVEYKVRELESEWLPAGRYKTLEGVNDDGTVWKRTFNGPLKIITRSEITEVSIREANASQDR